MSTFAGLLSPRKPMVYFFSGDRYLRYEVGAAGVDSKFPRSIGPYWPGLFEADIDCALPTPDGTVCFFRGTEFIRYDMASDKAVDGYPQPIADGWPGVFPDGVDAAVRWPGQDHAFFFRGDKYVRYDFTPGRTDGSPLPIARDWPALVAAGFDGGVDTVIDWPDGTHVYFFRGDKYLKYEVATGAAVAGYPKPVAGNWPGLPFKTPGAAPATAPAATLPATGDRPQAVENPGGGRLKDKTPLAEGDKVIFEGVNGRDVPLHRHAAAWWGALVDAARAGGIAAPLLLPTSGYRTAEHEEMLWARALKKYGTEEAARKWVAKPGGSPHRTGRAIDCWLGTKTGSENVDAQRETAAWKWLVDNAERFGFYPYTTEPWHWEYNPPAT